MTKSQREVLDLDAVVAEPTSPPKPKRQASFAAGFDIRQWYVGLIAPRFDSAEALARMGNSGEDLDLHFSPIPWLREATRQMRDVNRMWNPSPVTMSPTSEGGESPDGDYVLMEPKGKTLYERLFSRLGEGSIRGCSAALAATSVGSGALAVPHAFSLVGVGLGAITLILVAAVSAASLQVLMVAARYTGVDSYAAVLELSLGSNRAAVALDVVMTLNGIGALVCILIFEGDFIPAVLAAPPGGLPGIDVSRIHAIVGIALVAWPLAIKEEISSLRHVALIVPVALLVTVLIVLCDAPAMRERRLTKDSHENEVVLWHFGLPQWLQASAIMVNAMANHTNAVPTANQLDNPSIARIVKVTCYANSMVLILFLAIGIGGYYSFGGTTAGDFLLNYPDGRQEIWACRLMLGIIVFIGLPVCMLPTAKSVAQLLLRSLGRTTTVSSRTHRACASILLILVTCVAMVVSDVAAVIGPLGGLLATSLMFWFPAIVYRKLLWPTQPRSMRGVLLAAMVFFGILGWSSVIASFFL
mmetsp:Transcript_69873/g.167721  ORF Transcript_69873/g.167721 Transcript_69873/m.167721 type:complete len:528 (+) Transcript_69873:163-1746(+)